MAEKIKTDAVLCALPDEPDELLRMIGLLLKHKNIETMEAHNPEEMLALLHSHVFRGMITVSSWLPEDEVMARNGFSDIPSIKDVNTIILVEPQHYKYIPDRLIDPIIASSHDWVDMPFDVEEVMLRALYIWRWPLRR